MPIKLQPSILFVMLLLQIMFTYLPAMHTAFGSQSIGLREWGLIIAASVVVYIVIEFDKWLCNIKNSEPKGFNRQ